MENNSDLKRIYYNWTMRLVEIIDIVLMMIPFAVAWFAYYDPRMDFPFNFRGNWVIVLLFVIVYWLCARVYQVFRIQLVRIQELIYSQLIAVIISDVIMFIIVWILFRRFPNIIPMILLFLCQGGFAILWGLFSHRWYFSKFKPRKTVIVYDMREGEIDRLLDDNGLEIRFDVKQIISIKKLKKRYNIYFKGIQSVFLSGIHSHDRNQILKYCIEHNISVYVIPRVGDLIMSGAQRLNMLSLPMLKVQRYNPAPEYLFFKRVLDIIFSAIGLAILSPVMLGAAIAIKVNDKGPVFYRQRRLTKDRKVFKIIKFRSMIPDAEGDGIARLSTGEDDKRITSVGRVLRKFRIDEIPQLINVIKGDMSLVGPRPERPEIAKKYENELSEFSLRLQVKAGLTGYAQVFGKYNTSPYDKLLMDLIYISKPNLAEDVRIVLATIKILFIKDSTEGVNESHTTATINDISLEELKEKHEFDEADD